MAKSLKDRIHATLAKHGPATTDTIAQRISVKAKLISPRLSDLRAARKVSMVKGDGGEDVWRAK